MSCRILSTADAPMERRGSFTTPFDNGLPSAANAATKTPSPPSDGGEGRGEEVRFETEELFGMPLSSASPHSCVVGRGRRKLHFEKSSRLATIPSNSGTDFTDSNCSDPCPPRNPWFERVENGGGNVSPVFHGPLLSWRLYLCFHRNGIGLPHVPGFFPNGSRTFEFLSQSPACGPLPTER